MPETTTDQYVLLPMRGMRVTGATSPPETGELLRSLSEGSHDLATAGGASVRLRVIDSIDADGAKLVELSSDSVAAVRALQPGLRLVPVVYYAPAVRARERVLAVAPLAPAAVSITVRVVSDKDGEPVAGAIVVAFTDFAANAGAEGVTDAQGEVSLALGGPSVKLESLYVYPNTAMWSLLEKDVAVSEGSEIRLHPLELDYTDGLRHFYGNGPDGAGAKVKVAVVDTGVDPHPDLVVDGGENTVTGEDPKDFASNGVPHGTHVAGIIAARGTPPSGIRGVAPGVTLRAYRVFAKGAAGASNFAIAKAVDRAVADGCDLINMSLGGGSPDPVLQAAVEDARTAGSVCIVAAGNDGQAQVSFPASDDMALAVGALGRQGTFPGDSAEIDTVQAPFGTDEKDYVASFSNTGTELDLIGPGVGIISTVPGGYAEISGTSMACPAVTGAAARVVAAMSLGEKRDAARSAAIVKAVAAAAKDLGFAPDMEGNGLPEPPK